MSAKVSKSKTSRGASSGQSPSSSRGFPMIVIIGLLAVVTIAAFDPFAGQGHPKRISESKLEELLKGNRVRMVKRKWGVYYVYLRDGKDEKKYDCWIRQTEEARELLLHRMHKPWFSKYKYTMPTVSVVELTWYEKIGSFLFGEHTISMLISLALLLMLLSTMFGIDVMGKLNIGGGGNSKRWNKKNRTKVRLSDVQGMQEQKQLIAQVIDYYKHPDKYRALGASPPKGGIMVGAPGTGKTLLAKAVAGEADVEFLSVSGSTFEEVYVGVGQQRMRSLFARARKLAPCIVFIDEIDAIGGKRSTGGMGQSMHDQTLNQLLVELDGFDSTEGIFVLGSTNRESVLEPALLRKGRLGDIVIYTNYPTPKERESTFIYYLKKMRVDGSIVIKDLAHRTPGFSYADIADICNKAGLIAASKSKLAITLADINEAIGQEIGGIKRQEKILSPLEAKIVSHHEIGHAFVAHCLEHAEPLVSVNIMPRIGGTLGFAQYLPKEKSLTQLSFMLDEICVLYGGRAAEEVFFGEPSTGAQNDLERAYKLIRSMVTIYGMNAEIGHLSYYDSQNPDDFGFKEQYSQDTKSKIDDEIRRISEELYAKTLFIVQKYRDKIEEVAHILQEKEEMSAKEFEELVGPRDGYIEAVKAWQQGGDAGTGQLPGPSVGVQ